ncbi:DUF6331 family protein [Vibrio vulnificus]|nr:DUF6331 family protein [Vibrio vulnificus]ELP6759648.1 hypothetical protein [Vibrio vulnificus]MDK2622524.1 DUF6331 family protein [Vibrio vulnificus]RAH17468.1 hypothetical protein DOT36_22455 [Vibrio vulnificus]HDY7708841.1 hypothetical protein [Vibrio vulnificus]
MESNHNNDISIGDGLWIENYVDVNGLKEVHEIDVTLIQNPQFWNLLEQECVSACCGIDAFIFWPEDVSGIAKQCGREELKIQFSQIIEAVLIIDSEVFISKRLNASFKKSALLKLLRHIENSL